MLTLSVAARNLLKQNTVQLVETLEFSFRGESQPSLYVCNFPEPIQWPGATGNIYQPLGYKRDSIRQSIQTGYEPLRVQVVNVNQEFLEVLTRREVYGARITVRRLFRELLDDAAASLLIYRGVIASPLLDESTFTFNIISILASYNVDVPKRMCAPQCQWRFGDNFCGIDLESQEHNHYGEVMDTETGEYFFEDNSVPENPMLGVSISGTDLERVSGNAYWKGGFISFLSGKNAGISRPVQHIRFFRRPDPGSEYEFTKSTHHTRIKLFVPLPYAPEPGDKYRLRRGCLKTWADCKTRYNNGDNFGGIPTMPRDLQIEAD